jgi:phage tail sheath gpL-like
MGDLALTITGLSANDPVPGTYLEVLFAQGEVAGGGGVPKVLFIGPKTSSGDATTNTQVYALTSVQDAVSRFGTGSPIHRSMRRFVEKCKTALCYGIAPAESAGTQATGHVTLANAATAAGTLKLTLCGETIEIGVTDGMTATAAATALKNEINLQTHWPVTAANTTAAVTMTARIKGNNGNMIRYRSAISGSIAMTASDGGAVMSGGATDESYTTVLSTIESAQYEYIVPCVNVSAATSARIGAVKTAVVAQALPTVGIRQQVICAHGGTNATAISFAAATNGGANQPRVSCAWQEKPEWEPMEVAAYVAGLRYSKEVSNPVYNYDSYGLGANDLFDVPKQYGSSDWPTRAEISAAISGGLSPVAVSNGVKAYVVRMCTCSTDVRVRDTSKVTTADKFATDLTARYTSQWAGANVQDDPSNDNVQVAHTVCTPNRLKGLTIQPLYKLYAEEYGFLDSDKTMDSSTGDIAACTTGIDPVNTNRINARIPLHVMPLLHQFAAIVSENSAG